MCLHDKLSLIRLLIVSSKKNVIRIFILNIFIIISLAIVLEAVTLCRQISDEYNRNHLSDCYCRASIDCDEEIPDSLYSNKSVMSRIALEAACTVSEVQLRIDGNLFSACNYFSGYEKNYQNITSPSSEFEIGIYNGKEDWFPPLLFPGEDNTYLQGEFPSEEKELIIDDYLLRVYGLSDASKIIGKQISITLNSEVILENYTVTGVYKDKIYELREGNSYWGKHYEHMLVHFDSNANVVAQGDVRYYFSDFEQAYQYMITRSSEDSDIMASDNLELYIQINQYSKSVGMLITVVSISAIFMLAVNEIFTIITFNRDNRKFRFVLEAMGSTPHKAVRLETAEYLILALLSTVLGAIISIGLDAILRMMLAGF